MGNIIQADTNVGRGRSSSFFLRNAPLLVLTAAVLVAAGTAFWFAGVTANASEVDTNPVLAPVLNLLPGDAAVAAAAGDQTVPAIAQGGNLRLAVWTDNRPNPSPFGIIAGSEYETSRDIYGVRIDAGGNVLDAVPIAIVAGRANQDYPRVSWNGTNWLVVYQSVDIGGTGAYQLSIEAVRVSPAGQVLDAKPIKLYGLTSVHGSGSVASDGNNWVIVAQGTSTGNDIVAVRISAAGVVLDPPTRVLISATESPRFGGLLAYAGGVFVFNYGDSNNIPKLGRFDSSLTKLPAATLPSDVQLSALTSNGSAFYAVWHQQAVSGFVHVVGSRVSTAGALLDNAGSNISGTKEPSINATTAVVWDGLNWRVTWGELNTSYSARVNTSGVVLDPGSVAVANVKTGPTAGNGAGSVQVMWTEFITNDNDIAMANISPSHVAGAKLTPSAGAPQQTLPDIATSGSGYMLVYRSATSTQGRVLAQPLDAAGNPLTAQPVELDSGININGPGNPNVAWNGSVYLVSWRTSAGIVAQRLSPAGAKLDAAPFMVISGGFGSADIAAVGSNFLVTGQKVGISIQFIYPVAARVSGAGAVLDASPLVLGASYAARAPAVVELGGRWFAAWHRNPTHDGSTPTFSKGIFIETNGTLTSEFDLHGPFSTAGGNGYFEVGLASNGTRAFFVQSQELTSGVETDLLGFFIEANGTVSADFNMTPWEGNQYKPRAAWDGTHFIVAFQDQRSRITEQAQDPLDARSDLYGMRVSPTGTIIDPQGFLLSGSTVSESDPNLVSLNGVTLFAGAVMKNDTAFANYRIVYEQRNAALNKWPVAVANATPIGGNIPLTVNFSSAGSGDPDGTIAGYLWDFGDGSTATTANPSHTYTASGPFVTTLTVTDNGGAQARQTVFVKADAPNQLPVAVASAIPVGDPLSLNVNFYADGSYDPDGFLGNIEWSYSDGGTDFGSPAYHSFASAGTYTATLTVYDRLGATATRTITVHVGTAQTPTAAAPFDFDGDSKTDISVFRPNAGSPQWWVLKSTGGNFATQFGAAGDVMTPADYTGDGKADVAFFRPSNGSWFILRSEDLTFFAFPFGTNGDTPAPGDYDGDNKVDAAVFRPSNSTWFISKSSGGTTITAFGAAGDVPINNDYDGDGKNDIAIYRPNAGNPQWWIQRSTAGLIAFQFGAAGDKTVAGDYTGDGKADVAFFRPSTGFWYVLRSEDSSFYAFPFGNNTDTPAPGDYDGDGKNDAAVFRPSANTWYINRTGGAGVLIQPFGAAGDIAIPSAYVR